jgi:hypothetical protein
MKYCPKCKQEKPFSEFGKNSCKKDGLQRTCKVCVAEQSKKSYNKAPYKYKNRVKKQIQKSINFTDEYRKNNPCVKCGENRYWLLDFHHINPLIKEENIGNLKQSGSFLKLRNEMEKCIILCKNCHSDFHYVEKKEGISIEDYIK